jgi:putative lipoprotein
MRFWTAWSWAFACVCVLGSAPARAQDSWLGLDKGKHFGASAVLATGGYAASMLVVPEPWQRAALGGGFALTLGIAKELYDATGQGDPSLRDLTWDVIGCALGAGVALLVDYALRAPRKTEPTALHAPPQLQAAAW